MLCENCHKNEATFHYRETINGVSTEHHLCAACAANTDSSNYTSILDAFPFTQLLGSLLGSIAGAGEALKEQDDNSKMVCPTCKMSYSEFVKNSIFGCPDCYDVFGLLITDKLKKLHGSDTHIGKRPLAYSDTAVKTDDNKNNIQTDDAASKADITGQVEVLRRKLKEAVAIEDYEEAARLRDKIKVLTGKEKGDA